MESQLLTLSSADCAATESIGATIGARLDRGVCIVVSGPLGAGKTAFVRGLCAGLAVRVDVTSPTFILCEEYPGRLRVLHLDLYRLDDESEVEALGVRDALDGQTVVVAEWGERSEELMALCDAHIEIAHVDAHPDQRTLRVRCHPEIAPLFEKADA